MSYRISVNGTQLFGNNENYPEWDAYVRSQGIEPDTDGAYDGDLKDFHAGVLALEACVKRLMAERKADAHADRKFGSYFDFSEYERWIGENIQTVFDVCWEIASMGYAFMPFAFWMACRDMVEPMDPETEPDGALRVRKYRFKEGCTAHVHAG